MEFEKREMKLLASLELPELFITDYIPLLDSDSVKVYLYVLLSQKNNVEISPLDLSKRIGSTLELVKRSFEKLESLELLTKTPKGFIINDVREIDLNKLYSPKLTSSLEDANENAEKNRERLHVITTINNSYFQGLMSPTWFTDIDMMITKYHFSEEVLITLFSDCFNKGKLNHGYVKAVATAWNQNKIENIDDLEAYYIEYEKINDLQKKIAKKLGITRQLTQYEEAYIEKWVNEFKYSFEVIELALKMTVNKTNPTFGYIDKIICDWNEKGLHDVEDIKKYQAEFKQKEKITKQNAKAKNISNYSKREYTDLNNFYDNIKTGGD